MRRTIEFAAVTILSLLWLALWVAIDVSMPCTATLTAAQTPENMIVGSGLAIGYYDAFINERFREGR